MKAIQIDRDMKKGRDADLLDVCRYLGDREYGSAVNALATLAKHSPLYAETLRKLKASQRTKK